MHFNPDSKGFGPQRATSSTAQGQPGGESKATAPPGRTADGRAVTTAPPHASPRAAGASRADTLAAPEIDGMLAMVEGRHPELLDRSRQVLSAMHSSESLECALAAQNLLRLTDSLSTPLAAIEQDARALSAEFIQQHARTPANLSSEVQRNYLAALSALEELEPGENPSKAIHGLRSAATAIKDELSSLMVRNLGQNWAKALALEPPVSSPSASTSPSPSPKDAPSGRFSLSLRPHSPRPIALPSQATSASSHSTSEAVAAGAKRSALEELLENSGAGSGMHAERLEHFEDFLIGIKRVQHLQALMAVRAIPLENFNAEDPQARIAIATSAENFFRIHLAESAALAVNVPSDLPTQIRKSIDLIRSARTADPVGAALDLSEALASVRSDLSGKLDRFLEAFAIREKSKGKTTGTAS